MKLKPYLYRTQDVDNDGDPCDWGYLLARDDNDVKAVLAERIKGLGYTTVLVDVYPCTPLKSRGVIDSRLAFEMAIP